MSDTNFATLDQSIASDSDHQLAIKYAPRIRFDAREPFMPSVIGYTVFRETCKSLSFPREITITAETPIVIEYAVWWDWDIEHLYELEHIWVLLDENGKQLNSV